MAKRRNDTRPPATSATSATRSAHNTPKINADILKEIVSLHRENPDKAFIMRTYFFAKWLIEGEDLPRTAIALEMMQAAFSAFEGGLKHADIAGAYPVPAWREDTVEMPRAWARELVSHWKAYKAGPEGQQFGEAFGIDGHSQGKRPVRSRLEARSKDARLCRLVAVEYLAASFDGTRPSWNAAMEKVALAEDISTDTVKRRVGPGRQRIIESLSYLGILE